MTKEFFSAARRGDLETFKAELKKTNITAIDPNGNTALHIAAGGNHYNIVEYILTLPRVEEIINEADEGGDTALHLTTEQAIYELLINHNAVPQENHVGHFPSLYHPPSLLNHTIDEEVDTTQLIGHIHAVGIGSSH